MSTLSLTIVWMYPDLMNTYGDRGNIIVLQKRCEWRGINTTLVRHDLGSKVSDLEKADLIFMGGAQDRQQKLVSNDLKAKKSQTLKNAIEKGIPGLYICGAYQFLGHYYKAADGIEIPGLSIFDLYTRHFGLEKPRAIGNIAVEWNSVKLVGFENHGGRTYLGKNIKPFARVLKGYGNNGEDKTEGSIYKNSIGSYLHGPILPKNPAVADFLISKALIVKYNSEFKLEELNNDLEVKSKNVQLEKMGIDNESKTN